MPNFGGSRLGFWFLRQQTPNVFLPTIELNFVIDNSGSMIYAVTPIQNAIQDISSQYLKSVLVPYYGSAARYNRNVTVTANAYEETFSVGMLNKSVRNDDTTQVINIVFQDEASPYMNEYNGELNFKQFTSVGTNSTLYRSKYTSNIASLRAVTTSRSPGFYNYVTYVIKTDPALRLFRNFMYAVRNGTLDPLFENAYKSSIYQYQISWDALKSVVETDFAPPNGMSDYKNYFNVYYDTPLVGTNVGGSIDGGPKYYTNLIVDLLTNQFGFQGLSKV